MNPVQCACARCQAACASSTCLPTPDEARLLIARGYAGRLCSYRFHPDPARLAFIGPAARGDGGAEEVPHTRRGSCTFFERGTCLLHDRGFKPLEGRIALHSRPWLTVRALVCRTWQQGDFDKVRSMWRTALHQG